MKKKFLFSSLFVFLIALCGLFYGCQEDKYANLRLAAKFSYTTESNSDSTISHAPYRNGVSGIRVKSTTSNTVFDYYKDINLYVFYITNSSSTASANVEVTFENTPDDFNNGASFNFDNPIGREQGSGSYSDGVYSKTVVFYNAGKTTLTVYALEGNKKTNISVEVVRVANDISFKQNNYALPRQEGSELSLSPNKVLSINPFGSSVTNISYDFGYYRKNHEEYELDNDGNKVFQSFNTEGNINHQYLWTKGLDFNSSTGVLSVISESALSSLDEVVVKATYDNPLGEDKTCETTIKIVNPIEDFEIYYWNYENINNNLSQSSIKVLGDKINLSEVQNMVINIEDLNAIFVAFKVKNNKEETNFSFDSSINVPAYFVKVGEEYKDENGDITNASNAYYTYAYYKIVATKKTTDNIKYGADGVFDLNTFANYKNYTVDSYPLVSTLKIKNDTLVKNYSVNGVGLESINGGIVGNVVADDVYKANVYINDISLGTSLFVDTINPIAVSKDNSKFKINFYKISANNTVGNDITANVSEYFRIRKSYNNTLSNVNLTSNSFLKQTTFYIQADNSYNNIETNQQYLMVITSEEPSSSFFSKRISDDDLKDKKTYANVLITIVKGLEQINTYTYTTYGYQVDEKTGQFLRIDYENSEDVKYNQTDGYYYVLSDKSGSDVESNRVQVTPLCYDEKDDNYYKLVYDNSGKMYYDLTYGLWYKLKDGNVRQYYDSTNNAFGSLASTDPIAINIEQPNALVKKVVVNSSCHYIKSNTNSASFPEINNPTLSEGPESVKLDLSSGFDAKVEFTYLPSDANLDNVKVTSSNVNVVKVALQKDDSENEIKNKFILTPVSVGEASVKIYISNLDKTYSIPVSVYRPITGFYVTLKSSNFSAGIGHYSLDSSGKNVELAIVSYGKTVGLNLSTLPINSKDYSISYTIYAAEKYEINNAPQTSSVFFEKQFNILNKTYKYVTKVATTGVQNLATGTQIQSTDAENAETDTKNLIIGTYNAKFGHKTGNSIISDKNFFTFNCDSNTFLFSGAASIGNVYVLHIRLINLDGTYFDKFIVLESYSPVESISSTLDKNTLKNPNTISYVLKTSTTEDPTVVGVKIEVNKNSQAKATFDFDNYGTIRVIYGSNAENFYVENGKLTNLGNKNILLPIVVSKDEDDYFWFKLNENYDYSKNNGVIFVVFEIAEFTNIFSKTVSLYVENATVVSRLHTDIETNQIYFKLGLTEKDPYTIQIAPNGVYDKTLLKNVFEVVNIETKNEQNESVVKTYFVETQNNDEIDGSIDVEFEEIVNASGSYRLKISAKRAGNNVIVIMPQDKIISKALYDGWGNKRYVSYGKIASEEDYISNFYYTYEVSGEGLTASGSYVISNEYNEDKEYFICVTDIDEFLDIWQDYLDLYVYVADGVKEAYQISTINDLLEVSLTEESVTKKYVLVNNITWDTSKSWEPIGNYYKLDNVDDYVPKKYYLKDANNNFEMDKDEINSGAQYYGYGFNGSLKGSFDYLDIKNKYGQSNYKPIYYSITNISNVKNMINSAEVKDFDAYDEDDIFNVSQGFFAILGNNAEIENLTIGYNFYQPQIVGYFTFGGVAGINYGNIKNSKVTFNNYTYTLDGGGIVGGIAGVNFGSIENSDATNSGLGGNIKLNVKTKELNEGAFDLVENEFIGHTRIISKAELIVGGLVGYNEGVVIGGISYGDIEPEFNNAGFDSSLNIQIGIVSGKQEDVTSYIGGAIGTNFGYMANVSIQGKVDAEKLDNVGGLVGKAGYSEKFNAYEDLQVEGEILTTAYSVRGCYSTAIVVGKEKVGGAFGIIEGNIDDGEEKLVKIYFVSAENYAGIYRVDNRNFVTGSDIVGGFAGSVSYAKIEYCYVVSYFETNNEDYYNKLNYDIFSTGKSAGFIYNCNDTEINNSSSFVNCYAESNVGIFIGSQINTLVANIFARGRINKVSSTQIEISNYGYYDYYYNEENRVQNYYVDSVKLNSFNSNSDWSEAWVDNGWQKNNEINDGLPYLEIKINKKIIPFLEEEINEKIMPLYATLPITITMKANGEDGEIFDDYIKCADDSIILFYNFDLNNKYESLKNSIDALNVINLFKDSGISSQIAKITVSPGTYKTYRLDMTTSNSSVIVVSNDGRLSILKEGNAVITISSKLNASFYGTFNIIVKNGISNIKLYSNVSLTTEVDGSSISTLKSRNLVLYSEEDYIRKISVGTSSNKNVDVNLENMTEIGFRFRIDENDIGEDLKKIIRDNSISTISDILRINGLGWTYYKPDNDDEGYYYIDTPTRTNPILQPTLAIDDVYLKISYTPYIYTNLNYVSKVFLLDDYSGEFRYNIKHGATEIKAENNIDNIIKFTQLQTQAVTLTLYTDFEEELILSVREVDYGSSYTDSNILSIVETSPKREIDSSSLLSVMSSGYTNSIKNSRLESRSITYTLNYKDKINALGKDKIYEFYFSANSNNEVSFVLIVIVLCQDKISQVYGTVYASISDFPQTPEKENYIYNGIVGVLSLEVYPYISNYSKMKVYYDCALRDPMLITQLRYDINDVNANRLSNYFDSGMVSDKSDSLFIDKASGQDTFLLNNLGTYSYSKTYFLSMLVSSNVPDDTLYTIYVDFYNRNDNLVASYSFEIKTVAMPTINLSFDETLKGKDGNYYLPINTSNELDVKIENYEGKIDWEVECENYSCDESVLDCFIPYLKDGVYYVDVMRYNGIDEENFIDYEMIGETVVIKGSFVDNRIKYEASIRVLITLFTVTSISPKGLNKGYLTLPLATTSPLQTELNVYFDEALVEKKDNWYKNLCNLWASTNSTAEKGTIYNALRTCGYTIEDNFVNYIIQLGNAITKVDYNFNDIDKEKYVKKSGVWFYNDKTLSGESGYLEISYDSGKTRDYNNSTFGFEVYNGYPAVYGYQADVNSELTLKVNLSYVYSEDGKGNGETINGKIVNGIPNVLNYNLDLGSAYKYAFEFKEDFILNFTYNSDLINAIPISTEEEFLSMKEGEDYILVSDLELSNYTPISTEIHSLNGNNYTIYITSFAFDSSQKTENNEDECVIGLFDTLSENSNLFNVKVYYTDRTTSNVYSDYNKKIVTPNVNGIMQANLSSFKNCVFGGIVGTNNGVLTNCEVNGMAKIILNYDVNIGVIGSGTNGGLVAINSATGYITNSKVKNFNLSCYGETGGFVCENSGKIVSSNFRSSSIENLSSSTTGGFVNTNSGEIHECYSEGYRLKTDNDIRNTGAGILSRGAVGGFVFTNSGTIDDCYSNISLSSSTSIAGFVYEDTASSVISRCYSICYKALDDNSTVAHIFIGATSYINVKVNGTLNNCYYLSGTGNWSENFSWENNDSSKKAIGLDFGKFTTQSFTNYDLSLTYKTGEYKNKEKYNYVDGYTWVTIEGKPVLASTLVDTISQREYKGKSKRYAQEPIEYFDSSKTKSTIMSKGGAGNRTIEAKYYDNSDGKYELNNIYEEEDLICYVVITLNDSDTIPDTAVYNYYIDIESNGIKIKNLTINCEYDNESNSWKIINAYTEDKILDFRVESTSGSFDTDTNFRANDGILPTFKDETFTNKEEIIETVSLISNIDYFELLNVLYFYDDFVDEVSDKTGTRTNPQIIYDYNSFDYFLSKTTAANFYRVIKDIDFKYTFSKTTSSNFQGVLFGNYMELNNISVSYLNYLSEEKDARSSLAKDSFGLFSEISTYSYGVTDFEITMVSNLTLNVIEVLSNSHAYVGALAGKIYNYYGSSLEGYNNAYNANNKIILSNITVQGNNNTRGFIQGKNAVGGLAGHVSGDVIIKDISCSVNVNATKEMDPDGAERKYLIYDGYDINNVSYAGGVIGIFDANSIINLSDNKNFNANDISISGNISIIGGVVGSAFGYLGTSTVVNYVNTVVSNGATNFLKAISFAGGLVGENRGTISNSSVTYGQLESYSSVKVGSSELTKNNYFYNSSNINRCLAIGGLIGLNNGGIVSNSLTTINVRNKYSLSAGGAIGLMLEGTLENVISSGSVLAEKYIGGFIGMVEDSSNFMSTFNTGEYAVSFNSSIDNSRTNAKIGTIIRNCVAQTNWLISDYLYYKALLAEKINCVSGFIGVIVYVSNINDNNGDDKNDYNDVVAFEQNNYYSDIIPYTSTSTNSGLYLKASYFSHSDSISNIDESVVYNIENVWPYSTRELYYEKTLQDIKYEIKTNNKGVTTDNDTSSLTSNLYYTINSYLNIDNLEDFYTKIDLNDRNLWSGLYIDNNFQAPENWYIWISNRVGKFYRYNDTKNEFEEVKSTDDIVVGEIDGKYAFVKEDIDGNYSAEENYYFIGQIDNLNETPKIVAPKLETIIKTKTFVVDNNDFTAFRSTDTKYHLGRYYFEQKADIDNINSIWLNGIWYESLKLLKIQVIDGKRYVDYKFVDGNGNFVDGNGNDIVYEFSNGVKVEKIGLKCAYKNIQEGNNSSVKWVIEEVYVTYKYDINSTKYIYTTNEIKDNGILLTSLNISSKTDVFRSFDNGNWSFGKNFYLNDNYSETDKYPVNIEYSTVYVWTDENIRASKIGDNLIISTPEELAYFAYDVNNGNDYSGMVIKLGNDIDLSGKYWMPIGTENHPFEGTFDGQNYTIKYAVVNEKSYVTQGNSLGTIPDYAGVFGVVSGAIIKNLKTIGGNIYGKYASGVIGGAKNSTTISNVTNLNNVLTDNFGGGIVGRVENSIELYDEIVNNGKVGYNSSIVSYENTCIYLGGIIGQVVTGTLNVYESAQITNYGNVEAVNNRTDYSNSLKNGCVLWNIYAGGIAGKISGAILNNKEQIVNSGKVYITTNCDVLNVGGLFGEIVTSNQIGHLNFDMTLGSLNNKGAIEIAYRNSLISAREDLPNKMHPEVNIGGIVGSANAVEINFAGNNGEIDLTVTTTTIAYIGIGGIVGNLTSNSSNQSVSECYNSGDMMILTISSQTNIGVGGIVGLASLTGTTTALDGVVKTISNCYNSGNLKSDGNSMLYIGGIFGSMYVVSSKTITQDGENKVVSRNYILNMTVTFNGENEIIEESYFYQDRDNNKKLKVEKCLNIGQVALTNYYSSQNAIGAIVGLSNLNKNKTDDSTVGVILSDNYYLSGSAYSSTTIFSASSAYGRVSSESTNYAFDSVLDGDGAESKLSTTLKNDFGVREIDRTSELCYNEWDRNNIWTQKYDTWYPTLINNPANFSWVENQEKTNQEKGKYLIRTAEELSYIANLINTGIMDSNGVTFQLNSSIDLAGKYWIPIGNEVYPFKGTFEGNGYAIKNMTVSGEISNLEYGGFFGIVLDAKISNFGLESPIIEEVDYAGGVVYSAENTRIEKVYTDVGNSENSKISARLGVGGIACLMYDCKWVDDEGNEGGLYRSYNNVPVEITGKWVVRIDEDSQEEIEELVDEIGFNRTGGLVGLLNNSFISCCYNNSKGNVFGYYVSLKYDYVSVNNLIAGACTENSSMLNVFNLARILGDNGREKGDNMIVNSDGTFPVVSTDEEKVALEPTFENMTKGIDTDSVEGKKEINKLKEIWTNEYSLNESGYTAYPYLRGLGREWKNIESEALKTVVYTKDSSVTLGVAEQNILTYVEENGLKTKTMVRILDPSRSYVTQAQDRTCYLISTVEELVWVANNVNNGSLKTLNCEFILLNDIDLAGRFWTPIGNSAAYSFQGVFNFNGHVISNMVIDADYMSYAGLFGYASNAYIANGYIKNAFIKVTSTDNRNNLYVGTVVGRGTETTIVNMSVETSIAAYGNSGVFVGGIIGSLTGDNDYIMKNVIVSKAKMSLIGETYRSIDISSMKEYVIEARATKTEIKEDDINIGAFSTGGNVYCGGIVGYMSGHARKDEENEYLLYKASNATNIASVTLSESSNAYLGGIIGYGLEEVTLKDVKNSGKMKSYAVSKFDVLGGIIGYVNNGNISDSFFDGYLESCQDPNRISYVGGIVGNLENDGILINCVNAGRTYINNNYSSFAAIGGIIGRSFDHAFNKDESCVYLKSDNGFETSVGIVLYSSGMEALINESDDETYKQLTIYESNVEEDSSYVCYYKKGSISEMFNFMKYEMGDNFKNELWNFEEGKEGLKISHIYLLGCQVSFKMGTDESAGNKDLTTSGCYVENLDVILRYGGGGSGQFESGSSVFISVVDSYGNVNVITQEILTNSAESMMFKLRDKIQGYNIDEDKLIVCYVSLIT